MNPKYRLKDGVYLVQGAKRGAILDTNTHLVYSVNGQACKVCTYGMEDDLFWHTLISVGIAEPSEPVGPQDLPRNPREGRLRFTWFEVVTNSCNQHCVHCYADSAPNNGRGEISRRRATSAVISKKDRMTYIDWLKVIEQAHELGCGSCQFIGGEPLLYKGENGETIIDLITYTRNAGYSSIEIFTNATLLTQKHIQVLKDQRIKVAVSLYSDNPRIHDGITQTPGSFNRTMRSLELLQKSGVETRVETIVMKANQDSVASTLRFRKEKGFKGRKPDLIRPNGRGKNILNQPDTISMIEYGFTLRPNFKARIEQIARYRLGHPCLQGKIAITENGDILPCIFGREHSLGNYLDQNNLKDVIDQPLLQSIWNATKDHIAVCRDCEYRYVCFDCRLLAEAAARGRATFQNAPNPRCTYNPYSGEWGDGIWGVDKQGEPFYDQSLADEIKLARQLIEAS